MPVSRLTGSPNSEPLSVNIFSKTERNSYVLNHFSKRSNISLTAPLVQRLSKKARNNFSCVKNNVKRVLFDSLEECTVSISTKHWSSCSGNDECKSSLNYRMCLCDTNLKFGEHGPLWIWSLDLCIEKQQCL